MRAELQSMPMKEALAGGERLVAKVGESLQATPMIIALGLEVLALSVLATKPKPETARAPTKSSSRRAGSSFPPVSVRPAGSRVFMLDGRRRRAR